MAGIRDRGQGRRPGQQPESRTTPVVSIARRHPDSGPSGKESPRRRRASRSPRSQRSRRSSSRGGDRFAPGTVLADRYRIVELAGRGGMGEVYRAHDLTLDQTVALKFLPEDVEADADRLARLLDEVALARSVSHRNVCRMYDVVQSDRRYFLSMEYVAGEDSSALLRRIGRLSVDKTIALAIELSNGLQAIHDKGILHRDLKPSNLMIDERGHARISDFGLASLAGDIKPGEVMQGTPAYMAPEQLRGTDVSARSDIYALGLIIYKMLTGRPAFAAKSSRENLEQRLVSCPEPPSELVSEIDPELDAVVMRCLAPEPMQRPESAREVADALLAISSAHRPVLGALLAWPPVDRRAGGDAITRPRAARSSAPALSRYDGRVLDNARAALFDRPIDAVRYALAHQRAGVRQRSDTGQLPCGMAIHLAEIASDGRSTSTARGPAKALAALAEPGQILMTRGAFDLARQRAHPDASEARWLAHGSYEIDGLDEPVEVFEVGVAGRAHLRPPAGSSGARRQKAQSTTAGWRPAPNLALPTRPHWVIAEKLGQGGFGEVWLAAHQKTGDKRVFKFCYDAESLRALQREITLFRLLKESLGDRNDIVRILDWRFDEAPYFIESAYSEGGSLVSWADARGGLDEVALPARLEIVAQIATALAAAHSVGVLHKDIKPGNVLVTTDEDGQTRAQLGDFGIGSVTEPERLARAGITLNGFTAATAAGATAAFRAGTRLYIAPEIVEGKPASIQADIYALGVLLYQIVAGDFHRSLAPGWERDISDELLREDIEAAVDGSPERRLGDASRLATRLRGLEARHEQRQARRRERQESQRARQAWQRSRRRRKLVALSMAFVTVFAGAMAVQSYRVARESRRVAREAKTSQQVSTFLVELFEGSDPYKRFGKTLELRDILQRGAERAERELADQPVIRARLMHIIGTVHGNLGEYDRAIALLEKAAAARRGTHGDIHLGCGGDPPSTRGDSGQETILQSSARSDRRSAANPPAPAR